MTWRATDWFYIEAVVERGYSLRWMTRKSMKFIAHSHSSIVDQVAGAVVRSATNHTVGALMRGHGLVGVVVIAIVLILGVWAVKRLF